MNISFNLVNVIDFKEGYGYFFFKKKKYFHQVCLFPNIYVCIDKFSIIYIEKPNEN